jgi:hypothetical protein
LTILSTWRLAGRAEQGSKALDWMLTAEPALGSVPDIVMPSIYDFLNQSRQGYKENQSLLLFASAAFQINFFPQDSYFMG